jgi:hypothetical protein
VNIKVKVKKNMSVLPDSNLETIDYQSQGWSAIVTSNMQLLDSQLRHVLKGNANILGSQAQVDPAAQASSTISLSTVSGTGDDANINANFSAIQTQLNNVVGDISELRNVLVALLSKLRKNTGNGVLSS